MEFSAGFMSMISSALFIDGKLDRRLANRRAKTTSFKTLACEMARQSHRERERFSGPYRREMAFLETRYHPRIASGVERTLEPCSRSEGFPTWGIKGKNLYLLSVLRRRLEYPALKRAVREQQNLFDASVVLIEDKASGTQLIQELVMDGCHAVTKYTPECDKIMRLHAQTALIENGFVYVPESAPWLAEYLHEMTVFPKGKHDDQVDSTAQFLDWFKKPISNFGVFEYYRREYEKHHPPA
jgi:predicted phage terminase large subunit-like protein